MIYTKVEWFTLPWITELYNKHITTSYYSFLIGCLKNLNISNARLSDCYYYIDWFVHYAEWFVQRWMICKTLKDLLNDLHNVEWFVKRWKICTTLKDSYNVEWFVKRWKICTTLKDLYNVEKFIQRWMICKVLNDSDYNGWFVKPWIMWITIGWLSIRFLTSTGCAYSRKYCSDILH